MGKYMKEIKALVEWPVGIKAAWRANVIFTSEIWKEKCPFMY